MRAAESGQRPYRARSKLIRGDRLRIRERPRSRPRAAFGGEIQWEDAGHRDRRFAPSPGELRPERTVCTEGSISRAPGSAPRRWPAATISSPPCRVSSRTPSRYSTPTASTRTESGWTAGSRAGGAAAASTGASSVSRCPAGCSDSSWIPGTSPATTPPARSLTAPPATSVRRRIPATGCRSRRSSAWTGTRSRRSSARTRPPSFAGCVFASTRMGASPGSGSSASHRRTSRRAGAWSSPHC